MPGMLYEKYKDEAEFRKNFIRPLLTRLGFVAVAELHGGQEFGKDFVFSELTSFGFLRHYAAVVKHKKSIHQGGSNEECLEILSQVRQAFSVEFQLPDSEAESGISVVIVFNSGKISENARKWIRSELDRERYGRNVYILDGERLFQLDMLSTFHQTEQLLPRLMGMRSDIYLTIKVLSSILEELPEFPEARETFTFALEGFLAAPVLTAFINLNEVSLLIQECKIIDRINTRYLMGVKCVHRESEIKMLQDLIPRSIERANRLNDAVQGTIDGFRPLTELE